MIIRALTVLVAVLALSVLTANATAGTGPTMNQIVTGPTVVISASVGSGYIVNACYQYRFVSGSGVVLFLVGSEQQSLRKGQATFTVDVAWDYCVAYLYRNSGVGPVASLIYGVRSAQ